MKDAEFELAIGLDELRATIEGMMPGASQQQVAATMAVFLEEQPPDFVMSDDGVPVVPTDESFTAEEIANYNAYIAKLKEFAGEEYTALREQKSQTATQ